MDIKDMTMEMVEQRLAAIPSDLDAEGADLNALEEEVRSLTARKGEITAAAEKRKAILDDVAKNGVVVRTFKEDKMEEKIYGVESAEYRSAFYKTLMNKPLTEVEQRAYTSAAASAGAAIPTQTANELVTRMLEVAPLLSEITLLRIAGNVTVATQLTRDDAHKHAEGAAITASSDTLAEVRLAGYEFAKLVQISKTVQTMTVDAFETWLVDGIYEDVALGIEKAIVYGTGSSEPEGLAGITWTASTNLISTTASISYDNVCTLMTYPAKGARKGAKFLCNSSFPYTQLAAIKDSQNRPIYVESMQAGVPGRLMGREVLISDEVNDNELYYGNFKRIYGNLSSDITVESSTQSSFNKGLIDYRGFALFDAKVADKGAFGKFKKN